MKRKIVKLLVIAGAALPLAGCVDDSYDLSKDIDMTMGLGAEGLELRLGDTEKIMLADLLETDATLKTDHNNVYYLVKDGSSDVDFKINPAIVNIDNALLKAEKDVISFDEVVGMLGLGGLSEVPVGGNFDFSPDEEFRASAPLNYVSEPLDPAIHALKVLKPKAGTRIKFSLSLEQPEDFRFVLKEIRELTITFPQYLKLRGVGGMTEFNEETGKLTFTKAIENIGSAEHSLGEVVVDRIELGDDAGVVNEETRRLEITGKTISMAGKFSFGTNGSFTMKSGDKVKLHLAISIGDSGAKQSRVEISEAIGRFFPKISPTLEKINVSDNLPDFLQDEEVTVKVANPTLKLSADMSNIPASLNVSADLISVKAGSNPIRLSIPGAKPALAQKDIYNTLYFYQDKDAGPFDPEGLPTAKSCYPVPKLSTLIEKLPDYIEVKVDDNHITFTDEDCTLKMNEEYYTKIFYNLFVPFAFEEGLSIVYTDSVTDMNEDLKDFSADSLAVTANILNAIPLQLEATVEALDVKGNVIEGIKVTPATIAPAAKGDGAKTEAKTSSVEIGLKLMDGNLLKQVNTLRFRIVAKGMEEQNGAYLTSNQYIKVEDVRLKLKGQVVGDFNDNDD